MFTIACGVFVVSTLLWLYDDNGSEKKSNNSSNNSNARKNTVEKYSNEDVRNRLDKAYYNNHEVQDIARRLRTDSDFRYNVEKDMRRGRKFYEAIEENK